MILNDDLQKPQMIASSLFKHSWCRYESPLWSLCPRLPRSVPSRSTPTVCCPSWPLDADPDGWILNAHGRPRWCGSWQASGYEQPGPVDFLFFNRGVKRYVMVIAIQDVPTFKHELLQLLRKKCVNEWDSPLLLQIVEQCVILFERRTVLHKEFCSLYSLFWHTCHMCQVPPKNDPKYASKSICDESVKNLVFSFFGHEIQFGFSDVDRCLLASREHLHL